MKKFEFRESSHGHAIITIEDDPDSYYCGIYEINDILSAVSDRINQQLSEGYTIFLLGHKQIDKIKSIITSKFNEEFKDDYINT